MPTSLSASQSGPLVELSVVLPTYKEQGNVAELVRRLGIALDGVAWEAIFVDDNSPDGTWETAKAIAARDGRVRCLRRVGRRGLAGACIEGILSSAAPFVAVMDADLQHDETVLAKMLETLRGGTYDLVAATRYVEGGSADSFGKTRGRLSRLATTITRRLLDVPLSDPMSGFFMLRRDKFDAIAPRLSPAGFKILLDIAATAGPSLRVAEQSYTFGRREAGESKFNAQIGLEFLGLIFAKLTGDLVEPRFILFALVGALGFLVNIISLQIALTAGVRSFDNAVMIATFVSLCSNFFLNNELTYRDKRLKGASQLWGFIAFCVFGSIGSLTDVGIAHWIHSADVAHAVQSGDNRLIAGAAGAVMGVLWNYAMSSLFVWRTR